jgi:hypothetical protein
VVVSEILNDGARRQEELKLSPKERQALIAARKKEEERQRKARQKAQSQKINRLLLLLPLNLKEKLIQIAEWHGVPISQAATFLLFEAVRQYEAGEIDFSGHKTTSYSPRYTSELIHPDDAERLERHAGQKQKKGWG